MRYRVLIIDGQPVKIYKVPVHYFLLGDVEEPSLYAAAHLQYWYKTPEGAFVVEHAISKVTIESGFNPNNYMYSYAVVAELEEQKLSEFYLRFDKPKL